MGVGTNVVMVSKASSRHVSMRGGEFVSAFAGVKWRALWVYKMQTWYSRTHLRFGKSYRYYFGKNNGKSCPGILFAGNPDL
jgi:hypothetical protein